MTKVYLSPYTSPLLANNPPDSGVSESFAPLHAALSNREWPYDYGDDPTFFSRLKLNGALTWGVCRADVRSQVKPGDLVVFFSFTKSGRRVEYRLSAIATVEEKIRQSDIFFKPLYKEYQHYLNLLVRPADGNGRDWTHDEPGAPVLGWHEDWLSRVAPFRCFAKPELKRRAAVDHISLESWIDGKQFIFGDNYVLFSIDPSKTLVLKHPPIIAYAEPPHAEVWCDDRLSRAVFMHTIEDAQARGITRSLRLNNKHLQPHSPPIRWKAETKSIEKWRSEFMGLLLDQQLERC